MSKRNSTKLSLVLLLAMAVGLSILALPALAQNQGSSSAGQTTSFHVRGLKGPQPVEDLVVTAIDSEQAKIKLRHNDQGWEHWFELNDETVIRSAADKKQTLLLEDVEVGHRANVYVARKLLGGKTVYLTVDNS